MKIYLSLIVVILISTTIAAQQTELNFTHQNINFSAAPRSTINPMSIKLWDNYLNGGPSSYGTVLEIYGLSSHQTSQLYFGGWDDSKIRYREAFYADNAWNSWITLLDSKNNVESAGRLMVSGSGNHFINGGSVGIGTTSPNAKLEIISSTDYSQLSLTKNTIEGQKGSGIVFRNLVNNGELSEIAGIQAKLLDGGAGSVKGSLSLYTKNDETKIEAVTISSQGNMGIGTTTPNEKLAVNGKIRAKEIRIEPNPATWPDYVFEAGYKTGTLEDLEHYIKTNKHLPEMPTAKEVADNGVELGEMNKLLLKKVEELTLHLIEKDKQLQDSNKRLNTLEKESEGIKELLKTIQLKLSKL